MEFNKLEIDKFDMEHVPTQMVLQQVNHLRMCYFMQLLQHKNLNPGQAGILFVLNQFGESSQRELADWLGVKPPSVTVALQKMEKAGYITRHSDEKDQRITRIKLAEQGQEYVEEMKQISASLDSTLYQNMSLEEVMLLRRLLLQMRDNLLSSRELDKSNLHRRHHGECDL